MVPALAVLAFLAAALSYLPVARVLHYATIAGRTARSPFRVMPHVTER